MVSDAGSADATRERAAAGGLAAIVAEHEVPAGERVAVPFTACRGAGLPCTRRSRSPTGWARGRWCCWRPTRSRPRPSGSHAWPGRCWTAGRLRPRPAYARHRYEGTISRLLLSPPLQRALRPPPAPAAGRAAGVLGAPARAPADQSQVAADRRRHQRSVDHRHGDRRRVCRRRGVAGPASGALADPDVRSAHDDRPDGGRGLHGHAASRGSLGRGAGQRDRPGLRRADPARDRADDRRRRGHARGVRAGGP